MPVEVFMLQYVTYAILIVLCYWAAFSEPRNHIFHIFTGIIHHSKTDFLGRFARGTLKGRILAYGEDLEKTKVMWNALGQATGETLRTHNGWPHS